MTQWCATLHLEFIREMVGKVAAKLDPENTAIYFFTGFPSS